MLLDSDRTTLKPSGTPSIRISHENSSVAESRAMPAFRQLGHLSFSTQRSRAIHNMLRKTETFLCRRRHPAFPLRRAVLSNENISRFRVFQNAPRVILSPVPGRQLVATGGSIPPRGARAHERWISMGPRELAPFEASPSDGVFFGLT